jgi:uncharacterized membrane protein YagU involved in acid resistance
MFLEIASPVIVTTMVCAMSYFTQYLLMFEDDKDIAWLAFFLSFVFYPTSFLMAAVTAMEIWGKVAMPYGAGVAIALATLVFILMLCWKWLRLKRSVRLPDLDKV